jgi:HK97 gp10 family phage protein
MDWANNAALQNKIKGMREAKAAFQALPDVTRDRMLDATETTVREIVRFARGRIQSSPSIRTRQLLNHIDWKVNKQNGRGKAGVSNGVTPLRMQPYQYAHFVELGTSHSPAEPFMLPAAEDQKQPYLARCRAAGKAIESDTAAIGLRNL